MHIHRAHGHGFGHSGGENTIANAMRGVNAKYPIGACNIHRIVHRGGHKNDTLIH